jgi:hypothetical protein
VTRAQRAIVVGVIAVIAGGISLAAAQGTAQTLGFVQDARYHHVKTGVQFLVPPGWIVMDTAPSSDGGEMVQLRDAVQPIVLSAWMIRTNTTLEGSAAKDVADRYRHVIGMKIRQRFDSGARDYWVPAESIQEKTIGDKSALTAVGEFTENGKRVAECLAWIFTERTGAFFFMRVAATDLQTYQYRFDQIVETATVP